MSDDKANPTPSESPARDGVLSVLNAANIAATTIASTVSDPAIKAGAGALAGLAALIAKIVERHGATGLVAADAALTQLYEDGPAAIRADDIELDDEALFREIASWYAR